jgi:hypothetical protein
MWQDLANIMFGLILIAVSFVSEAMNQLNTPLMWTYIALGSLITLLSLWGLIDELRYAARLTEDSYQ